MDKQTLQFYNSNFQKLAEQYNIVSDGISRYFSLSFISENKILDIGCGSGRDLKILKNFKYNAFGVDPCKDFVNLTNKYIGSSVASIDSLPNLSTIKNNSFNGVLCSAVLMHLPKEQLFDASFNIRRILKDNGRLLISIPLKDKTINPKTKRDENNRLFNRITPENFQLIFERIGFKLINKWEDKDSLNRNHRKWSTMLFTLENTQGTRPIDTIESVLNKDKKVATYKLALFRSLAELATTNYNLAIWTLNGNVLIPVENIAEKWVEYYWPIFESEKFIPQIQAENKENGKQVAFRKLLTELIQTSKPTGGLSGFSNFIINSRNKELPENISKLYKKLISNLKNTIKNGPIKHSGGIGENSVFGYRNGNIVIPATIWRELSLMGTWIQDATILRWAELTAKIAINSGEEESIKPSTVIDCLLTVPIQQRNVYSAKSFYDSLKTKECVWSGKTISDQYAIDHAIPFTLWKNNDLWNLFPADPKVNGNKKDKLPSNNVVTKRKDCVIYYWELLKQKYTARFEYEAKKFGGVNLFDSNNWQNKLFSSFTEAIEITAIQRGIERWKPTTFFTTGTENISAKNNKTHYSSTLNKIEPFNIQNFFTEKTEQNQTLIPFIDLKATASPTELLQGIFSDINHPDAWLNYNGKFNKNLFIVQITGDSMEPKIPNHSYCLFKAGNALGGTRVGKTILFFSRTAEGESKQLMLKRYFSEKKYDKYGNFEHTRIELHSLNKKYKPLVIEKPTENEIRIIGEFVKVLCEEDFEK